MICCLLETTTILEVLAILASLPILASKTAFSEESLNSEDKANNSIPFCSPCEPQPKMLTTFGFGFSFFDNSLKSRITVMQNLNDQQRMSDRVVPQRHNHIYSGMGKIFRVC